MIQNEHQYKVTTGEIEKLQQVVDKLSEQAENLQPQQLAAMQNGFQTQIDRMKAQLQEYDRLNANNIGAIETS